MSKFLNKYVRKFHRWLALPFVVILLTLMLTQGTPAGNLMQRMQQLTMLTMGVTGVYLFLLPYLAKWQRRRRVEGSQRRVSDEPRYSGQ